MNPIRLLALDIDGTLAAEQHQVSPLTRTALHQLDKENIHIVIVTGRRYRTTRWVIENLGLDTYSICNGGTLVKCPKQNTLHQFTISPQQTRMLCSLAGERKICLVGQRESHQNGGADFVIDSEAPWNTQTHAYYDYNREYADTQVLSSLEDELLNIGCFGNENTLSQFATDIERSFPGEFDTVVLPHLDTGMHYCEILKNGVNKWTALMTLASELDIKGNEICAVGDQRNDIPMVKHAGHGFAMGNAHPDLKKIADKICGDHDKDGLLVVIDYVRNHNTSYG